MDFANMGNPTEGMTPEELIGQSIIVGFEGTDIPQELSELLQHYHVGNVILFSRNIQNAQQVLELTQRLQAIAKAAGQRYPLLVTIDQENGMVRRLGADCTPFPGNMALGAINTACAEEITRDIAQMTGRELNALGINMNLAPVVDINNNPANPVIGIRSFGEDPHRVASLTRAAVQGYQSARMISCLKHFPGHGDTMTDSHLALPTIGSTLEELTTCELLPFTRGIEAGADCIMSAHIHFPALMGPDALSATVSAAIVQNLLRKTLDFDGVVISDCMKMSAILKTVGTVRGTVMALQSGVDLVLISHDHSAQQASLEAIYTAISSGELALEQVQQAAERVLRLKARYLSWDTLPTSPVPAWVCGEAHRQLSKHAYVLSTTLVRDDDKLLPLHLQPTERILIISQQGGVSSLAQDQHDSNEYLTESVCRRHKQVRTLHISRCPTIEEHETILRAVHEADITLMMTMNAYSHPETTELLCDLAKSGRPIIGIATLSPYDTLAFPQLPTYLATYEYTEPALETAVRVLFGEIQAQGQLPVSFERPACNTQQRAKLDQL